MNIKEALKPVPQPYKSWIARTALVLSLPISLPIVIVTDSWNWCKEEAGEVADAWRSVKNW